MIICQYTHQKSLWPETLQTESAVEYPAVVSGWPVSLFHQQGLGLGHIFYCHSKWMFSRAEYWSCRFQSGNVWVTFLPSNRSCIGFGLSSVSWSRWVPDPHAMCRTTSIQSSHMATTSAFFIHQVWILQPSCLLVIAKAFATTNSCMNINTESGKRFAKYCPHCYSAG